MSDHFCDCYSVIFSKCQSCYNIIIICFLVYYSNGYVALVHDLAEENMNDAVSEVKALPDNSVKGEVGTQYYAVFYLKKN